MGSRVNAAQHILVLGVRVYRWGISPAKMFVFGPLAGCRYTPSCSEYALEAVRNHGALTGTWLTLKRLSRCHPWGGCGWDPVPPRTGSPDIAAGRRENGKDAGVPGNAPVSVMSSGCVRPQAEPPRHYPSMTAARNESGTL